MSTDAAFQVSGLATADVAAALAELAAARNRVYYDAEADAYYHGVALERYADLVTRSHTRRPAYKRDCPRFG